MPVTLQLALNQPLAHTAAILAPYRHQTPVPDLIILELSGFIKPRHLGLLTSWALEMRQKGVPFRIIGGFETENYLARMGFYEALGLTPPNIQHNLDAGRFLPIKLISSPAEQKQAVDELCEMILRQFEHADQLLPSFEWAVNEITDNILNHAQTATPGVMFAQHYAAKGKLEIAIVDQGLGLLNTLSPTHNPRDAAQAINLGLTRGITRDANIGQGNGLAGTKYIAEANRGIFYIWTSGAGLLTTHGPRTPDIFPETNGTGILLILDVNQPVDLSQSWIGEPGYTYIDAWVGRLEDGEPLLISAECESIGSRDPARRLRNKISTLLTQTTTPVVLDFSDIRGEPSSSFLDELFGRLALQMGVEALTARVHIQGLSPASLARLNVVVRQRLGAPD